jgi:hypothetical protein
MNPTQLMTYLKSLGFHHNSYTLSLEYHSFHYVFEVDNKKLNNVVISICRDENGKYRQQFGREYDIFNVKYLSDNKNMLFDGDANAVYKFITQYKIGNFDALRDIKLNQVLDS